MTWKKEKKKYHEFWKRRVQLRRKERDREEMWSGHIPRSQPMKDGGQ